MFGAGPNRFGVQYLRFKPIVVNPTVFWNAEFSTGFGFLPTFTVTQGLVGLVLWIVLMIIFAYTGSKSLRRVNDGVSRYFIMSSFFSALFLWIAAIVYVPSHSILIMTFVFSGLFLASLINNGQVSLVSLRRDDGKGATKFIPAILLVIIAITVIWLAVFVKKTIALGYFHGGISSFNLPEGKGLPDAEAKFMKALAFDKVDTYYQAMSEINISKITLLAQKIQAEASQKGGTADPEAVKQLGKLIDDALQYSRDAIAADPTNYYNNLAEARISEVALSLQIQNAYETTRNAYANALRNNPYNPSIYLSLARVEASQNKIAEAQRNIGSALQLKQNYLDAIFLLSQIQVSQGQIKDAITSVQVASQINPENPQIFFQLGLLYYNDKNYTSAVDAFTKAVKLDNKYANAQYFLGLSYARLNKFADAIIQFENLSVSNPDNEEVGLILKNLKAGKSPFADAKPPIDSKPEQRKSLPIKSK